VIVNDPEASSGAAFLPGESLRAIAAALAGAEA
jgi:hypothetical protein